MTQALLDEAKTALHKLLTGTKVVSFNDGHSTVQYNQTSINKLQNYIDRLEISVNQTSKRKPPARLSF